MNVYLTFFTGFPTLYEPFLFPRVYYQLYVKNQLPFWARDIPLCSFNQSKLFLPVTFLSKQYGIRLSLGASVCT